LTEANDLELKSIVIPLIGTGTLRTPIPVCAKAIQDGIVHFIEELSGTKPSIQEIDLCVFEKDLLKDFQTSWKASMKEEEEK